MPSLADQLAKNASLNAALYVERSRRKPPVSYLFTGRDADKYDLETIHALAVNAFLHLSTVCPRIEPYEEALFSERAKNTDRTLLSGEEIQELDKTIGEFLVLLGPYLMEAPTGKVLEWLVKRFRIQEFNIDAIMALFLPYHETPHFTKMISILDFKPNGVWTFLVPYKSAAQNIQRVSLVSEMLKNGDLARFVTSLLPEAVKEGRAYRTLLAFNAATLHEFIKRSKVLDEGTLAFLLPALLEPLQQKSEVPSKDAILGSYILLADLSQKCELAEPALKVIFTAMASTATHVSTKAFISAAIATLQPQAVLEKVSQSTSNTIVNLEGIHSEITAACKWSGSEKLLLPIVTRLSTRMSEAGVVNFLENIVASPSVPEVVLVRLSILLANATTSGEPSLAERRLLGVVQQRHPAIIQQVTQQLIEDDEDMKDVIEQLVLSLSVTQNLPISQPAASSEMILASTHADSNVREIAVKKLVASSSSAPAEENSAIQQALLARLYDNDSGVLESLYSNPSALSKIFLSVAGEYIETLSIAIASPSTKPKRAVLRLHLAFLSEHVLSSLDSSQKASVFENVFLPFLLFSKPRQHTAELVWDFIVEKHATTFELLKGISDIWSKEKSADRTSDAMVALNNALALKIADNVTRSDDFSTHLAGFVAKLNDENSWTRSLAFLVCRGLLERLSGSHQLQAGKDVLEALKLESLPAVDDLAADQAFDDATNAEVIGKHVVGKPNSKTTLAWLQIALVGAVARISKPSGQSIDWFNASSKTNQGSLGQYVSSVRTTYILAASSGSLPALAMGLLQTLFASLGDDALVFLAGLWTSTAEKIRPLEPLVFLHAAAFLEAHAQEQDGIDFQTILPALLVGLQSSNAQSRATCMECIARLRIIAGAKLTQVYKFDVVYGSQNQNLQYLDQDDLKRYLDALSEQRDHFEGDATYLALFHGQYLVKNQGDRKRDSEYRKRVLAFVLSHINAVSSPDIQAALLGSVRLVQDRSKLQLLLPTIQSLLEPNSSQASELSSALVSSFNVSVAKDLNDASKPYWSVLLNLLKLNLPKGPSDAISNVLVVGLRQGLFNKLDQTRKQELCNTLLDICCDHQQSHVVCKQLLSNVLDDTPVVISLLNTLSPSNKSGDRAAKRARTTEAEPPSIAKLAFFAEALNTRGLPGSIDLVSHLLQALNSIVQTLSPVEADVNYTEQLLMSAIDSAASQVKELPNLAPSAIRLDVLVELIRVTDNPQTFHQALVLMSNLTRLAPDSVLHNIMPVFTFMGSNVFHRDDAASFNVVQKTIDGIVPVMVSSLKRSSTDPLKLAIEAKDFLHIFTDAANHIPRHRRTKFFSHLVAVLGAQEFLAPVCMLLVEKQANKVVRQSKEEARASMSLPISLLANSPLPIRIAAVSTILGEVERLCSRVVEPAQTQPTFLSATSESDQAVVYKRRAQALLILTGLSFETPIHNADEVPLDAIVTKLIVLSTPNQAVTGAEKLRDTASASQKSLGQLLSIMPAMSFLAAIASILETDDARVQTASLDLLSQRIVDISKKTRELATGTIVLVLTNLKRLIPRESDAAIVAAALRAVQALAATLEAQEHGAAAELVPLVLKSTGNAESSEEAWKALLPLSRNLGPRIIPHFRAIVHASVGALRSPENASVTDIQSTLQGLLSSIPTFWASAEVLSLFNLYIDQSITPAAGSLLTLIKTVTKRVPAKILLPALMEMWPPVQNPLNLDRMAAYFELVFRTLHGADRASVLEHLRPVFKMFLEALDFAVPGHQLETNIITAFRELVVKLNESVFRPLFRRLYDWAFAAEKDDATKKVVFIHLYLGLQDYFKGLMSPYMSFLLQPFEEILKGYTLSSDGNQDLWMATISSLLKALSHDESGFWRNDKLRQISNTLTAQVAVAVNFSDSKDLLKECLAALTEATNDDVLVKLINLNILMHTRSEEARLRLYALDCSVHLWRTCGMKLLGFVAETATFIAECSEDENDMVVKEAFKLKTAVENVAGKIDDL